MELSDALPLCITAVPLRCAVRAWGRWSRPGAGPPGSRTRCFRACQGSATPPGPPAPRRNGACGVAFRVFGARRHPRKAPISGLHTLPARSPVNASLPPLPGTVHDSGPVWVASPSLSETCTLSHRAGLSRHTRTPAVSGAQESEQSGGCWASAPLPCSAPCPRSRPYGDMVPDIFSCATRRISHR
jgi:hypothetical protein